MFKKDVKLLNSLVILQHTNKSEQGAIYFDQQNVRTHWLQFMTYFININLGLKHNHYIMNKTNEILLKPEGFKYYNSLDLITGYYHMCLCKDPINLFKVIILYRKQQYKLLSIGVRNSPENYIRVHIDELLMVF